MGSHTNPEAVELRIVLDALRRLVRELRQSAITAERNLGISGAQLFVLQTLAQRDAVSINDLAERTLTHQSSVSVVVSRLTESGWVRRKASATDARRLEITLTTAGRSLVQRAPEPAQARLFEALRQLPGAHRRALSESLVALVKAMGASGTKAQLFFEDEQQKPRAKSTQRKQAAKPATGSELTRTRRKGPKP